MLGVCENSPLVVVSISIINSPLSLRKGLERDKQKGSDKLTINREQEKKSKQKYYYTELVSEIIHINNIYV